MELKKPISLEEQVQRLIFHKMDVADNDLAKHVLSETNYYRFTGYALQFRDKENPDDYTSGTTFEDVLRLIQFDNNLRRILKPYLDTVELYARSQIAYGFAMEKCQIPPHDQHYESSNFFNKKSHDSIISSSLKREKENNKDAQFVIHHSEKYEGKMPIWVIVELISFTNLSKLYSAMYYAEQNAIAKNMGTSRETLKNHLHCLANLRNKVAHTGRLYNVAYNPPVKLGSKYLNRNNGIRSNTLFAYLTALLRRIPREEDKTEFVKDIEMTLKLYSDYIQLPLIGFPVNYKQLLIDAIK